MNPAPPPAKPRFRQALRMLWKVCKFGLLPVLILIGLTSIGLPIPLLTQGLWSLLVGWVGFLGHTLPQVRLDLGMLASGFIALLLAAWSLHRFAGWLTSRTAALQTRWKPGWTIAFCALAPILFISALASVGLRHQIGWLSHTQWVTYEGASPEQQQAWNAELLARALEDWAKLNGNRFPDHLAAVMDLDIDERYEVRYALLGANGEGTPEPWIYLAAGLTLDAPGWLPVLAAPRSTSADGRRLVVIKGWENVWLATPEYQTLMERRQDYFTRQKIP